MRIGIALLIAAAIYAQSFPSPGPGRAAVGGGGAAAITYINSATASGNGAGATATLASLNCAGANAYVIALSSSGADTASISGYTATTVYTDAAGGGKGRFFYKLNVTGGATDSFSVTSAYPAITVYCFANVKTASALDGTTGVDNAAPGGAGQLAGSITPSEDGEVLITGLLGWADGATPAPNATIDNGYATPIGLAYSGANHYAIATSYKIQTTAAAINPKWSIFNGTGAVAHISLKKN